MVTTSVGLQRECGLAIPIREIHDFRYGLTTFGTFECPAIKAGPVRLDSGEHHWRCAFRARRSRDDSGQRIRGVKYLHGEAPLIFSRCPNASRN
jgi:hypothetical protein